MMMIRVRCHDQSRRSCDEFSSLYQLKFGISPTDRFKNNKKKKKVERLDFRDVARLLEMLLDFKQLLPCLLC